MKKMCEKLKVNKKNIILLAGLIGCIAGLIIGSNIYKSNKSCYSAPSSEDEEVLENDETLENEEDKSTE